MTLLLALVVGWCLISVVAAFGLGPVLGRAAHLAEQHEQPRGSSRGSAAA